MRYIMFLALLAFSLSSTAQSRNRYYELGVGIGTLNASGDIATTNSMDALLAEVKPNFKVYGKKHFNSWFAIGIDVSAGWIYASDANHSNQARGLSVETGIFQANPFLELSLIPFGKFRQDNKFTMFVQMGGGYVAYNPNPNASKGYPADIVPHSGSYHTFDFFVGGGAKFRVGYRTILTFGISYHMPGVDDLDGIVNTSTISENDVYGGVYVGISRAFF